MRVDWVGYHILKPIREKKIPKKKNYLDHKASWMLKKQKKSCSNYKIKKKEREKRKQKRVRYKENVTEPLKLRR